MAPRGWSKERSLVFKERDMTGTDVMCKYIKRCGHYLEQLTLPHYATVSLRLIQEHCKNLNFLACSTRITRNLNNIFEMCRQLPKLRGLKLIDVDDSPVSLVDNLSRDMVKLEFRTAHYSYNLPLSIVSNASSVH